MNLDFIRRGFALLTVNVEDVLSGAEGADTSAFDGVSNSITNTGYGIYSILGIFAVLVFLIIGGFTFVKGFVMGTVQERQEFKSGLLFKLLMIIGFFALAGAIVLLSRLGANLFSTSG